VKRTYTYVKIVTVLLLLGAGQMYGEEKNAALAMALCVVPGGGQFYTERYVPGILIGAAEVTLGYYAIKYHREENYSRRNSMLWWGALVFGFSLADAYVAAKMYGFDVDADIDRVRVTYKWRW
jgi:hypothetical protein